VIILKPLVVNLELLVIIFGALGDYLGAHVNYFRTFDFVLESLAITLELVIILEPLVII